MSVDESVAVDASGDDAEKVVIDALRRLAADLDRTVRHLDRYVSRMTGEPPAAHDGAANARPAASISNVRRAA